VALETLPKPDSLVSPIAGRKKNYSEQGTLRIYCATKAKAFCAFNRAVISGISEST
jgi:hypothetical protein